MFLCMFYLLHYHFIIAVMGGKAQIIDALTKYSIIEQLKAICKEYHERLFLCESQKWDLEYEVRRRDYEVRIASRVPFILVQCDYISAVQPSTKVNFLILIQTN